MDMGRVTHFSFEIETGGWDGLALTKATALWIWTFLVERSAYPETAQARENGLEALDLLTFWEVVSRFVIVSRTLLLLLLGFRGRPIGMRNTSLDRGCLGRGGVHPGFYRMHET